MRPVHFLSFIGSPFDKAPRRDTLPSRRYGGVRSNPHRILKRVLFVCTGNTCRSPMAEALFRGLVKDRADYEVASAGVAAAPGMPASRHSVALLREKNLPLDDFTSRMLNQEMLRAATHVFAMSAHHATAIVAEFPEHADKIYLVSEFAADDGLRGKDVSDPFGQGRAAYEDALRDLEKMLPSVVAYIDQTWRNPGA